MKINQKYVTISFGKSAHLSPMNVIQKAAKTKDEHRIRKALEPWGEDRDDVIHAIAAGNFELLPNSVQVTLPRNEEET